MIKYGQKINKKFQLYENFKTKKKTEVIYSI